MECSRCGSQNVRTFEMAHASYNVRPGFWNRLTKLYSLAHWAFYKAESKYRGG